MVPKAINSVIWRIGLFYVGSVVLLGAASAVERLPGRTEPVRLPLFSKLGVPYIGSVMNIVVLTAALSSLNSGLYSTGRILRSMSMGGSAPKFMSKMSRHHVPPRRDPGERWGICSRGFPQLSGAISGI